MIRKFRKRYGISQDAMAGLFGISRSYLAMLESGLRAPTARQQEIIGILEKIYTEQEASLITEKFRDPEKFPRDLLYKKLDDVQFELNGIERQFHKTISRHKKNSEINSKKTTPPENVSQYESYIHLLINEALEKKLQPLDREKYLELEMEREALKAKINFIQDLLKREENGKGI